MRLARRLAGPSIIGLLWMLSAAPALALAGGGCGEVVTMNTVISSS